MNPFMELAVVREALQSRLLVELMGNAMHKELVLKGGMAMRAVHGSVRYTKDIDLDADLKHSKERVQGIVKRSILLSARWPPASSQTPRSRSQSRPRPLFVGKL